MKEQSTISRHWHHIDATDKTLGRLASEAAKLLIGKGKVDFAYHIDGGDYVVITNAAKMKITGGGKMTDKKYYRHSGYMGNLKETNLATMMSEKPDRVIKSAVKGMLPNNKTRDNLLRRLKIYVGADHKHNQIPA
jgi:large subunit ribosomal protein L13